MSVSRKQFLLSLTGSAIAVLLQGCGGGGDGYSGPAPSPASPMPPPPPAPPPGPADTCSATQITGNHGHMLTIPKADTDSTVDKIYDIQGSADHNHTVTLTTAMLAMLKAGNSVTVTSSTTFSHNHDVTVKCA